MRLAPTLAALLVAAATLAPGGAAASCAAPAIPSGVYVNVERNTRSITTMDLRFVCGSVVRDHGGGIGSVQHGADPHWRVRLWGACSPRDCDWGTARGTERRRGAPIVARYDQGFARREVQVVQRGALVEVRIRSTYTDGRAARVSVDRMRLR